MKNSFQNLIKKAADFYQYLKELEEIPLRHLRGDFYEEKRKERPAPRKNKVKVDDLRPRSPQD